MNDRIRRLVEGDRGMRLIEIGCLALLAATIVPLLLIAPFDHPGADDLSYGLLTHEAVQSGGGLLEVLSAAANTVVKNWWEWQGTYSAIFLMALQPGVFSEQAYAVVPFFILGSLVAGELFLSHVLLVERLHFSKRSWISITCLLLVVQILYQPNLVEGFYWFNGAMYYTSFTALMFALMGMLIRLVDESRTHWESLCIGSALVAAFLAGGNFVTVLLAIEAMVALLVWVFVMAKERHDALRLLPPLVCLLAGATISFMAPGNSVRSEFFEGMGVISTIVTSCVTSVQAASDWTNAAVLLVMCIVGILTWSELDRASFTFPRPWLLSALSMGWLASSWAPTFYAMGSAGSGRVFDIRYDLFIILLAANVVWWLGNVRTRQEGASAGVGIQSRLQGACTCLGLFLVVDLVCIASSSVLGESLSSASALRSLVRGEAQEYSEQVYQQIDTTTSASGADVSIPLVTTRPNALYDQELTDDPTWWVNSAYAQWYGKQSITGYEVDGSSTE